jgi:L-ascorbate metabolism protein UlaG (beta-lactamase superfamily)
MRISRRRFIAVTAIGAAGAYIAAACGDDSTPSATSSPAPSSPGAQASASPTLATGTDNAAVGLRWFGQSMFLMTSPGGTTVLLDPFNDIGYTVPPPLNTNVATITHEHPDHNNGALGGTAATVIRGLTADGYADVDQTIGDVHITTLPTYHDDQQGALRGRNAAFVFETAGLRIAHLGDLGHQLDASQLAALGKIDVLMVPTGGGFSVGSEGATRLTAAIAPTMVFPMHYQTTKAPRLAETADPFLAGKTVQRVGSTDIRLAKATLPEQLTAYVLDYE